MEHPATATSRSPAPPPTCHSTRHPPALHGQQLAGSGSLLNQCLKGNRAGALGHSPAPTSGPWASLCTTAVSGDRQQAGVPVGQPVPGGPAAGVATLLISELGLELPS